MEGNLKKVAQSDVWDIYKIPNAMTRASQTKKTKGVKKEKHLSQMVGFGDEPTKNKHIKRFTR